MNEMQLGVIDQWIYDYLSKRVDSMPKRLSKIIAYYYTDARIRKMYWEKLGVKMGKGTYANIGMMVVPNENIPCVVIGENVSIAPNVTFVCASNPNNGSDIKNIGYVNEHLVKNENICIDDEAWIGANVTILPGIKVGRCSVIGAGSVVTRDVEQYSVYAGVPARKIRSLR